MQSINYILKLRTMSYLSKRKPEESEEELNMSYLIHKIRILSIDSASGGSLEDQMKRVCIRQQPKAERQADRDSTKKPAETAGYRLVAHNPAPSCSSFLRSAYDLGDMAKLTRNKM